MLRILYYMDKQEIEQKLQILYETYGKADFPEVTPMENVEEFLKSNGAMTLDEFIARVGKL